MKWRELKKLINAEVKDDEQICMIDLSGWGGKGISFKRMEDGVWIWGGNKEEGVGLTFDPPTLKLLLKDGRYQILPFYGR